MAIIKAVSSRASIGKAVNYVTKDEKTEEKLISGKDCNPQSAIDEMKTTKEMWGKTTGREYYHFVQSFPPEEKITPAEAHTIAQKLAEERFKGHEVVIATHQDKDHVHTHFIVNSVNHEDGYKLHWSKHELQRMKDMSDNLCREYGKSICERGQEVTTYNINKYKALERAITSEGNYKSYVLDCYKAVSEVKEQAINREDFVAKMKDKGYETNWSDNRKHITFTDIEGNKVRNTKLEKDFKDPFGKEELERGFESNFERTSTERRAKEQLERAKELNRGTGTDDTRAVIDNLNATIDSARNAVSIDDSERRDRIAQEQSFKREQDRAREQKVIERNSRGFEIGD